jgi:hypothetical protein
VTPSKEFCIKLLKTQLEHARALFIYHAGQRLTAIYYFFVAYTVAGTAYVGLLGKDVPYYIRLLLGIYALVVTVMFWGLDMRNAQLVRIDEKAMAEIEKKMATGLSQFELVKTWDKEGGIFQYKYILKIVFLFFATLSLLVVGHALYLWSHGESARFME